MKPCQRRIVSVGVVLALAGAACGGARRSKVSGVDPRIEVAVDRRVELVSIVCRLAGYPEYGKAQGTYADAVDAHFAPFREHGAVQMARALKREHGISFNAPIGLAVYLDDAFGPRRELVPPLPGLDERWNQADPAAFVRALQAFARDSGFDAFFAAHAADHADAVARVRTAIAGYQVIDWFEAHFGARPATFRVVPGLLSGTRSYAARAVGGDGREEVVQVLSLPAPGARDLGYLLVHELAHSYVNPILDERADVVLPAAQAVFERHAAVMERQHYTTTAIMTNESVVRALVVLYARDRGVEGAGTAQLVDEYQRGFLWIKELTAAVAAVRAASGGRLPPDALAAATRDVFAAWRTAHP